MSRSIFDPTSGNPEHSGSTFTPPDADQISHLPEEFENPRSAVPMGTVGFHVSAEPPAIDIHAEEDGKLLVVKMTGKIQKEDYRHFVPAVDAAVARHGKVRMLVDMHDFHGWTAAATWEDIKFDAKHFHSLERIAMVGEKTWERWMAIICKPFTTAKIRYFPREQEAQARGWIVEK